MRDEIAIIALFIVLSFIFSSCTITMHESNFFFPETCPKTPDYESEQVTLKNVEIKNPENIALSGVIMKYKGASDTILYFYGNMCSVSESMSRLKFLCGHYKKNVVCFDYRAYGYSGGSPSFAAIMSDGIFIYDYIKKDHPDLSKRVFVYTQSIGTVPGLEVAVNRPITGIIMEAGFTEGKEAVAHMTDGQPDISRFLVSLKADDFLSNYPDQPVSKIKRLKAPLLYFHGTQDDCFPYAMGKELFAAAGSKKKTFCTLEGQKHTNLDITQGKYLESTEKFLAAFK